MHRLTATDTPMVRYTRTIFPSYAPLLSEEPFFVYMEEKMKNHEPNQTTIEAIEEGKQMLDDPNTPSYSTTEELITALDK